MRIHLHTICWNDRRMLDFFFRHYEPWVDRFYVADDGSTDGSREYLAARKDVVLTDLERPFPNSFIRSALLYYDTAWKRSVGEADWAIVTNLDEHLFHSSMTDYLERLLREGCTAVPSLGYQMISHDYPAPESLLWRDCRRGAPWTMMSKLAIFRPDKIRETNFEPGRHQARLEGEVVLPERDEVANLHFKYLGVEETLARHAVQRDRLGSTDVARGWGHRYRLSADEFRDDFARFEANLIDVHATSHHEDHPGKRWWRRPGRG